MKGIVAAARSSRKYYLDRVLTVLLSFTSTRQSCTRHRKSQSWFSARSVAAQRAAPSLLPRFTRQQAGEQLLWKISNTNL